MWQPETALLRDKIARFCNVAPDSVIQSVDVPSIYEVPVKMHEQHLDEIVLNKTQVAFEGEPPWPRGCKAHKSGVCTVRCVRVPI